MTTDNANGPAATGPVQEEDPMSDTPAGTGLYIPLVELQAEMALVGRCPDCKGGQGIVVDTDGPEAEWHVVRAHDVPCPSMPIPFRLA